MTRTTVRPIVVATPVVWMAAIFLAGLVAGRPAVGMVVYSASAAIYEIGGLLCHQLPERSFYFHGAQLPVCARCTGLYLGAAVTALMSARMRASTAGWIWNRARPLLCIAAAPTAVTLLYEWFAGSMPGHWIRAAAGVPLGAIVMLVVLAAASGPPAVEIH